MAKKYIHFDWAAKKLVEPNSQCYVQIKNLNLLKRSKSY